ncbi:glycosyl hydrolase-related protein [Phytohabitans rumicis]|uniref:glycosyl hydrolase-related protein n=1 Tax=Phytohabitans rumicis TaxID=1076125 RepID=UPI001FE5CDEE|nr:glycosyl hydrolase-related protein [Phytohabitans rumicis]
MAEGYALNLPARVAEGGAGAVPAPLVRVDNPAVVVEAVKLADDRSGDVVVRLYEAAGGRATATVRPGFPTSCASVVDLLERRLQDAPPHADSDGGVHLSLRPFQIVTLRFARSTPA